MYYYTVWPLEREGGERGKGETEGEGERERGDIGRGERGGEGRQRERGERGRGET